MENTKTRLTVLDCLKETTQQLGTMFKKVMSYEEDNSEIKDINDLRDFLGSKKSLSKVEEDDLKTIVELQKIETELNKKKEFAKKSLEKQLQTGERATASKKRFKIVEKEEERIN